MNKIPLSTAELIQFLNHAVPHRCPHPEDAERAIWLYAGKRALVDQLISMAHDARLTLDLSPPQSDEDDEA